jgi:hypothetical protein
MDLLISLFIALLGGGLGVAILKLLDKKNTKDYNKKQVELQIDLIETKKAIAKGLENVRAKQKEYEEAKRDFINRTRSNSNGSDDGSKGSRN